MDRNDDICPVLRAFYCGIDGVIPKEHTDQLQRLQPLMIGSRDRTSEEARAKHLAWTAIRVFTPPALRADGLHEIANHFTTNRIESFEEAAERVKRKSWSSKAAFNAYWPAKAMAAASGWLEEHPAWSGRVSGWFINAAVFSAQAAANAAATDRATWSKATGALEEAVLLGPHGSLEPAPAA